MFMYLDPRANVPSDDADREQRFRRTRSLKTFVIGGFLWMLSCLLEAINIA